MASASGGGALQSRVRRRVSQPTEKRTAQVAKTRGRGEERGTIYRAPTNKEMREDAGLKARRSSKRRTGAGNLLEGVLAVAASAYLP